MMRKKSFVSVLVAGACTIMLATLGGIDKTVDDGVFTTAQAERGRAVYRLYCATCHGDDLAGGGFFGLDEAPALRGDRLLRGRPHLLNLYAFVRESMPPDTPGTLKGAAYADIVAYLLRENGFPAGADELPEDPSLLGIIRADRPSLR